MAAEARSAPPVGGVKRGASQGGDKRTSAAGAERASKSTKQGLRITFCVGGDEDKHLITWLVHTPHNVTDTLEVRPQGAAQDSESILAVMEARAQRVPRGTALCQVAQARHADDDAALPPLQSYETVMAGKPPATWQPIASGDEGNPRDPTETCNDGDYWEITVEPTAVLSDKALDAPRPVYSAKTANCTEAVIECAPHHVPASVQVMLRPEVQEEVGSVAWLPATAGAAPELSKLSAGDLARRVVEDCLAAAPMLHVPWQWELWADAPTPPASASGPMKPAFLVNLDDPEKPTFTAGAVGLHVKGWEYYVSMGELPTSSEFSVYLLDKGSAYNASIETGGVESSNGDVEWSAKYFHNVRGWQVLPIYMCERPLASYVGSDEYENLVFTEEETREGEELRVKGVAWHASTVLTTAKKAREWVDTVLSEVSDGRMF